MNKIASKIYNLYLLIFAALVLSGCSGGGSGAFGALGDAIGGAIGGGGGDTGGGGIVSVHSPEPSSLLLMGSGLLGMAIYAKAKFRNRK